MRTIDMNKIGPELVNLVNEQNPIDEDIGILGPDGHLTGAVISRGAYEFFLTKVEEEEDRLDNQTVEDFHRSGEKDQ